jgi:hypothetical protein
MFSRGKVSYTTCIIFINFRSMVSKCNLKFSPNNLSFQKLETKHDDSVVIIYFKSIGEEELCPTLSAFRVQKVAKQKPSSILVYDYYDTGKTWAWKKKPNILTLLEYFYYNHIMIQYYHQIRSPLNDFLRRLGSQCMWHLQWLRWNLWGTNGQDKLIHITANYDYSNKVFQLNFFFC